MSAADYRDALDRAERCEDDASARQLFERAQRTGDITLAKALATVGVEKGWTGITSEFFTGSTAAVKRRLS